MGDVSLVLEMQVARDIARREYWAIYLGELHFHV